MADEGEEEHTKIVINEEEVRLDLPLSVDVSSRGLSAPYPGGAVMSSFVQVG